MQRTPNKESLINSLIHSPQQMTPGGGPYNSSGIDSLLTQQKEDVQLLLAIGAVTGSGTVTLAVQHSDTDGSYAALLDRDGNAVSVQATAADSLTRLSFSPNTAKRWRRYVVTVASFTDVLASVVEVSDARKVEAANA